MPVLHAGYLRLFNAHPTATVYLLGRDITNQFRPLVKDLRALDPSLIKPALNAWAIVGSIEIATVPLLEALANSSVEIIMPDEDISHELAKRYFPNRPVKYELIFLRWDRRRTNTKEQIAPSRNITPAAADGELMQTADRESRKSSDIFRQVGALLARDGQILLAAHNHALPTPHTAWIDGDPRINFNQAADLDAALFIHAEAALIAEAARRGLRTAGASVYINTFPCPPCAKLLVSAGIAKCYFARGYSMLDSQQLFKSAGIELVHIDVEFDDGPPQVWVPYPENEQQE